MKSPDPYREIPVDFGLIREEVLGLGQIAARNPALRQVSEAFYQAVKKCVDEAEQKHPKDQEAALQYLIGVLSRYYLADEWFPEENYAHMAVKQKRTPHSASLKYAAAKTLNFLRNHYADAFENNPHLSASPNFQNFQEWEGSALNYFESNFPALKQAG